VKGSASRKCRRGEPALVDRAAAGRPIFLIIVADDLGFSDLGEANRSSCRTGSGAPPLTARIRRRHT